MPALITHHSFGLSLLENTKLAYYDCDFLDNTLDTSLFKQLFLLGNQGPDPFFYAFRSLARKQINAMGRAFQLEQVDANIKAFCKYIFSAETSESAVLQAYFCGYLCHFALDRTAHPLVDAQGNAGVAIGGADLTAKTPQIFRCNHAQIEADIDSATLYRLYKQHNDSYGFLNTLLATPVRALLLVSKMYARVADDVFGIALHPKAFYRAVLDMRFVNRFAYSNRRGKRKIFARVERYMFTHSIKAALAWQPASFGHSLYDNACGLTWINPHTDLPCNDSLDALISVAQADAQEAIVHFKHQDSIAGITKGFDFRGRRVSDRRNS